MRFRLVQSKETTTLSIQKDLLALEMIKLVLLMFNESLLAKNH